MWRRVHEWLKRPLNWLQAQGAWLFPVGSLCPSRSHFHLLHDTLLFPLANFSLCVYSNLFQDIGQKPFNAITCGYNKKGAFECAIRHTEPVQCFCALLVPFRQKCCHPSPTAMWTELLILFFLLLRAIAALKAATSEGSITLEQVCHFELWFHLFSRLT